MKRNQVWRIHSWLGLAVGIPMILIAVTGSILVFKHELDTLLIPQQVTIPKGETRMGMDQLIKGVDRDLPNHHLLGWATFDDVQRADVLFVMENGTNQWQKVFLNGNTGEILAGPRGLDAGITDWILSLHYTFLGGHLGMLIVGLLAVLMCALGVTGIIIYKRFWKNFFSLNWKNLRVLMGDFHRKVGIFSAPVFFILGLTGAWWNLTHAIPDLAEHGLGEEDPVLSKRFYSVDLSLEALSRVAAEKTPSYRVNYISFPREEDKPISFYGQVQDRAMLRSEYGIIQQFDTNTGAHLSTYDIREQNGAVQLLDSFRPLHFGYFGGLLSKLIWCILGLSPGVLAVTGFVVYMKRRKKKTPSNPGQTPLKLTA